MMRLLTSLGAIAAAFSTLLLIGLGIAHLLQLHKEQAVDLCCEAMVDPEYDPRMYARDCAIDANSQVLDQYDKPVADAEISLLVEYHDRQESASLIHANSNADGRWKVYQKTDCEKRATVTLKIHKSGYVAHIATATDLYAPVTLLREGQSRDQGPRGIDRRPETP